MNSSLRRCAVSLAIAAAALVCLATTLETGVPATESVRAAASELAAALVPRNVTLPVITRGLALSYYSEHEDPRWREVKPAVGKEKLNEERTWHHMLQMLAFGVFFYFIVVTKYRKLDSIPNYEPPRAAQELMEMGVVGAFCSCRPRVSINNCCLACCCGPARAALTYHAAGIVDYWPGLLLTLFCQPCMVFFMTAFTSLHRKLGGATPNPCTTCLCAWCCNCCMIAQEAQAVDEATAQDVGCVQPPPWSDHRCPCIFGVVAYANTEQLQQHQQHGFVVPEASAPLLNTMPAV
eukprot:TRINITY_DN10578_c0_g1_i1.p1 TRINITY_DN10578_c0_g1~~TRINITY_DN10578_c0_g1_i1.p1  ORF type:complete len:293 (-),score=42.32 TRINITY_DN10578_c0_g1_i1:233-1111(-)